MKKSAVTEGGGVWKRSHEYVEEMPKIQTTKKDVVTEKLNTKGLRFNSERERWNTRENDMHNDKKIRHDVRNFVKQELYHRRREQGWSQLGLRQRRKPNMKKGGHQREINSLELKLRVKLKFSKVRGATKTNLKNMKP